MAETGISNLDRVAVYSKPKYVLSLFHIGERLFSIMNPLMKSFARLLTCLIIILFGLMLDAKAETCATSTEMDAATKSALQAAAQQEGRDEEF